MLSYSGIQLARNMGHKLDSTVRKELVKSYYPFRNVPCFLHSSLDYVKRKTKRLPLIIEFEKDCFELGVKEIKNSECQIFKEFRSISCCSTKLSVEKILQIIENNNIKKVYYDKKVNALLDTASPAINSPILQENNLTGKDITIAVLDTGIYPHQDLEGRITGFKDFVNNRSEAYDNNGHGTHCAGDAAGDGASSDGTYKGPAPEANVVGIKVLDKMGAGSLSTVITGVEWCIENQTQFDIRVLSLSLGSTAALSSEDDPVVKVVEQAWDNGIVVCAAAGNEGPSSQTIASPGISPKIITVGAADDHNTADRSDESVADFSSRGPTTDGVMKPDLLTPGVDIISLRSPRSYLDKTNKASRVEQDYISFSGTSMATPICAGVVAQLLQSDTSLTPDQVKEQLMSASEDLGQSPNVQGSGYLNAANLIKESFIVKL